MNWKHLNTADGLENVVQESYHKPQLIFKHSTRCSISSMAKNRLERDWNLDNVEPWYLDLIAYRSISNTVASELGVEHESPQAILLKDGVVIYDASHSAISVKEIRNAI